MGFRGPISQARKLVLARGCPAAFFGLGPESRRWPCRNLSNSGAIPETQRRELRSSMGPGSAAGREPLRRPPRLPTWPTPRAKKDPSRAITCRGGAILADLNAPAMNALRLYHWECRSLPMPDWSRNPENGLTRSEFNRTPGSMNNLARAGGLPNQDPRPLAEALEEFLANLGTSAGQTARGRHGATGFATRIRWSSRTAVEWAQPRSITTR
jgi:hypothetical protein